MNVDVVFTFGLGRERRINRFLERLLHDRKAVERDVDSAGAAFG